MDLQFNVESEPRNTLPAIVNGRVSHKHSHIVNLVVVNPMNMLSLPLIAATKVSAVGQYMFEQADHSIYWLGSL